MILFADFVEKFFFSKYAECLTLKMLFWKFCISFFLNRDLLDCTNFGGSPENRVCGEQ